MVLKRMKRRHSRAQATEVVGARAGAAAGDRARRRPDRRFSYRNGSDVSGHAGFCAGGGDSLRACVSLQRAARYAGGAHAAVSMVLRRERAARLREAGAENAARFHASLIGHEAAVAGRNGAWRPHRAFRAGACRGRTRAIDAGADYQRRCARRAGRGRLMAGFFFAPEGRAFPQHTKKSPPVSPGLLPVRKLDDAALEELEEVLITADLGRGGRPTHNRRIPPYPFRPRGNGRRGAHRAGGRDRENPWYPWRSHCCSTRRASRTWCWWFGVNGTGKTTTIGKMALAVTSRRGKRAVLVAGDTFRAAAVEQLQIWGERTGAPGRRRPAERRCRGPGIRCADARAGGRARRAADRYRRPPAQQGRADEELAKIIRVLRKQDASAPHSVLLVLDATTGQNAVQQVRVFRDMVAITGLVVTSSMAVRAAELSWRWLKSSDCRCMRWGVGEKVTDLRAFEALDFARGLVGNA